MLCRTNTSGVITISDFPTGACLTQSIVLIGDGITGACFAQFPGEVGDSITGTFLTVGMGVIRHEVVTDISACGALSSVIIGDAITGTLNTLRIKEHMSGGTNTAVIIGIRNLPAITSDTGVMIVIRDKITRTWKTVVPIGEGVTGTTHTITVIFDTPGEADTGGVINSGDSIAWT